ncbi:hypothetical protein JF541_01385 [Marinobacter hydrocarbonoclasticus]|uniref:hypothetical protein n=1 Tax=Marinobacter nauticus TaxID=2743 RepID=UPI001A8DAF04|nr:hypothetical protein [Marinobacter nauticus]MCG8520856.1 hypothetical protein [Pseudomonadales bacterium]MEC9039606.1 hypothetical protein [Pseudomonadota bacterium]MBN8237784.1 hypothetical protein [Marinobacter nauticus]MEC9083799.1 hypothetical protein [Pseudomonadota bacterium]MED5467452.1 hypothetical protein [Pseudomonadota bacterium]
MSDRRGWHVDKGIPIAVIITVIILAVSISRDQSKQDERISLVETSVQMLQQARLNDQERAEKNFDELKLDLRAMNAKLDRLIESEYGR